MLWQMVLCKTILFFLFNAKITLDMSFNRWYMSFFGVRCDVQMCAPLLFHTFHSHNSQTYYVCIFRYLMTRALFECRLQAHFTLYCDIKTMYAFFSNDEWKWSLPEVHKFNFTFLASIVLRKCIRFVRKFSLSEKMKLNSLLCVYLYTSFYRRRATPTH